MELELYFILIPTMQILNLQFVFVLCIDKIMYNTCITIVPTRDFNFDNDTILFKSGDKEKCVEVIIVNDTESEGTETITLSLFRGSQWDERILLQPNTTEVQILANNECKFNIIIIL